MPGQVGVTELLVVLVIALLVLGPQRLPVVARNLGRGIREFKEAISFDSPDSHDPDAEIDPDRKRDRKLEERDSAA